MKYLTSLIASLLAGASLAQTVPITGTLTIPAQTVQGATIPAQTLTVTIQATLPVSSSSSSSSGGSSTSSSSSGSSTSSSSSSSSSGGSAGRTPSASGTIVPTTASQIVDSSLGVWTISGGKPLLNGASVAITGFSAVALAYFANPYSTAVYQQTNDCQWHVWYVSQYGNATQGGWGSSPAAPVGGLPNCTPGSASSSSSSSSSSSGSGGSSTSSSGSSSSSGGSASSSSGAAPAQAAAVGYNTQTFGSAVALGTNWFNWGFYGDGPQVANATSLNADGSLLLTGNENNNFGATIASAQPINGGNGWSGYAFGDGFYAEATLSFTGQNTFYYPNGGPAFWMLDIEHLSQGPYNINWPSAPVGCIDFFEVDAMEFDASVANGYQNGIATWYGSGNGQCANGATANPNTQIPGVAGGALVPSGTDLSQPHKYGVLWVPATGSGDTTTAQGYLKFYFDGAQVGSTFNWNYYDPTLSATYPPIPPVNGTSAMSGMDYRHMALILGTGTSQPMTVYGVTVWQRTAANNLTQ